MHQSFFGLTRRPFTLVPDPSEFVPAGSAGPALNRLRQAVRLGDGVSLITAAAGLGKTVLLRRLMSELAPEFETVLLASADFPTRRALFQTILHELRQPHAGDEQELRLQFVAFAERLRGEGSGLVLAIDEAHRLGGRLLEAVRSMTNWLDGGSPLVRVVLSGQLLLDERLARPELAELAQRITTHESLEPLTHRESAEYMAARVAAAGGAVEDVFDADAVQAICQAGDGVPRCLNLLGERALEIGAASGQRPVCLATVRAALDNLRQLSVPWGELVLSEPTDEPMASGKPTPRSGQRSDLSPAPAVELSEAWSIPQSAASIEVGDGTVMDVTSSPLAATETAAPQVGVGYDSAVEFGPTNDMGLCEIPAPAAPSDSYAVNAAGPAVSDLGTLGGAGSHPLAKPWRVVADADELSAVAEFRAEELRIEALEYRPSLPTHPAAEAITVERLGAPSVPPAVETRPDGLRPDQVAGGVLPMIAAVLHDSLEAQSSETSPPRSVNTASPGPAYGGSATPPLRAAADRLPTDGGAGEIESKIYGLVRDTQRVLRARRSSPASRPDGREPASRSFRDEDLGRPVESRLRDPGHEEFPAKYGDESPAPELRAAALAPPPSPRYGRLFSSLRKRIHGDAAS